MVRGWPQRFAGLGTLPMQDVKASIAELERCMTQLGLKGVEINDHVNGRTFEEPEFRPFWKAAEQMGARDLLPPGRRDAGGASAARAITCRTPSATWSTAP